MDYAPPPPQVHEHQVKFMKKHDQNYVSNIIHYIDNLMEYMDTCADRMYDEDCIDDQIDRLRDIKHKLLHEFYEFEEPPQE